MSKQNVSVSTYDAALEQGSQQTTSEAAQHATTTAYQAPYYRYERDAVPGIYMVAFHPDHTIAKYLAFLGREFDLHTFNRGYWANLDDQLFNAIRRDPGVEFVEDNVSGERLG